MEQRVQRVYVSNAISLTVSSDCIARSMQTELDSHGRGSTANLEGCTFLLESVRQM